MKELPLEDRVAAKVLAAMSARSPETFGWVLDKIEDCLLPKLKPGYRAVSSYAIAAARCISDVRVCDLGPAHAMALWQGLQCGNETLATYGGALKPRLRQAEDELGIKGLKDFVRLLPQTPLTRRRNLEVTDEIHREALRAIHWAWTDMRTAAQTLRALEISLRVPLRRGENASLRRVDVDLRALVIMLPTSKVGARPVPLTPRSAEILRDQINSLDPHEEYVWPSSISDTGHMGASSLGNAWKTIRERYCKDATTRTIIALGSVRLHDLRHFTCTQALAHGCAWHDVKLALGHSTENMTSRYAHFRMDGAKAAVERVELILDGKEDAVAERDARLKAKRWDPSRPLPREGLLLVDAHDVASVAPHLGVEEVG